MAAKGKETAPEKKGAEILKGSFKRGSPTLDKELAEFSKKLEALKKQLGFSHFIRAVKDEGEDMVVYIFAAGEQPPAQKGKPAPAGKAPPPVEPQPKPARKGGDSFESGQGRGGSLTGGTPRAHAAPPAVMETSKELKDDLGRLMRGKKRA